MHVCIWVPWKLLHSPRMRHVLYGNAVPLCPPPQAKSWITEKMQVANDESYRDPTNLEKKIQKHQEFDAEITANEQRIVSIEQVGVCRSHDIEQRI